MRSEERERLIELLQNTGRVIDGARCLLRSSNLPEEVERLVLREVASGITKASDLLARMVPPEEPRSPWGFEGLPYGGKLKHQRQCRGYTKEGHQCRQRANTSSLFCQRHQGTELATLEEILGDWNGGSSCI